MIPALRTATDPLVWDENEILDIPLERGRVVSGYDLMLFHRKAVDVCQYMAVEKKAILSNIDRRFQNGMHLLSPT
jgi:hypothetical protein